MEKNQAKLEISKQFSCSKEQLFASWTEPEQLKQWWKPLGKKLEQVTNRLNEGGTIRYQFDGDSLLVTGTYEKVDGNTLLEYTWNWHLKTDLVEDAEYKLAVRFEGDQDGSTLSVLQTGFENENGIEPHRQGWEQALVQLEEYINQESNAG